MKTERRRHVRIPGPFNALAQWAGQDVPVRILNLSEGGCYIEGDQLPADVREVTLAISFPFADPITVRGQALLNRTGGCAVLFEELSGAPAKRLERIMSDLRSKLA